MNNKYALVKFVDEENDYFLNLKSIKYRKFIVRGDK